MKDDRNQQSQKMEKEKQTRMKRREMIEMNEKRQIAHTHAKKNLQIIPIAIRNILK